jgi:hypothetical protein
MKFFEFFEKSNFVNVIVLKHVLNVFHDLKNVKIAATSLKIDQFGST